MSPQPSDTTGPGPGSAPTAPVSKAHPWRARAVRAVAAFGTMALFGWGALLLADHLDERRQVAENVEARQHLAQRPAANAFVTADPRMRLYLETPVNWSKVRDVGFGADRALFAAGTSQVHPNKLFQAIAKRYAQEAGASKQDAGTDDMELMPAVTKLWRLHMHIGQLHGIAFFLHASPDLAAAREGRLKLEPGGLILGFPKHAGWEYVTFFFPGGLDLDAYLKQFGPTPNALRELGPEVGRHLVPTLALGSGGQGLAGTTPTRGGRTVFCKSVGRSDEALKRAVAALKRQGWESRLPAGAEEQPGRYVLGSSRGELWITASDLNQVGGLITVLLDMR